MPEEICPVVDAYLRHSRAYWEGCDPSIREVFAIDLAQLDDLRESPNAKIMDESTQKLRAFYCLHGLVVIMQVRLGLKDQRLPLTRAGIQSLIKFCREARDEAEVNLYVGQLVGKQGVSGLKDLESERLINVTNIVIEASTYFRPRLATSGPLLGMGKFLSKGLATIRAPMEKFIHEGRQLLNTPTALKKDRT